MCVCVCVCVSEQNSCGQLSCCIDFKSYVSHSVVLLFLFFDEEKIQIIIKNIGY